MTKLEEKRDRFAEKYYEYYIEDFKVGFDASTAEWKRIVEPLVEALKKYETQSCSVQKLDLAAKEALEKYYEEVGE